MGARQGGSKFYIGFGLIFVMLMAGPAASAYASAKLRIINARPGSEPVSLKVVVGTAAPPEFGDASYAQMTPYVNVTAGSAEIALTGGGDGADSAQTTQQLTDGDRYTAVALAKGSKGFQLKVYRDGNARKGTARLRVLHAAPELGSPDIRLGERTIAEGIHFRQASPYLSVSPGPYALEVVRPGGDSALVSKQVALTAGVATTAILTGTGGAETRVVIATDQTVTPAGAPETGLGGLAGGDGPPWLLIALATVLAGTFGGIAQLTLARRSGRR